MENKENFLDLIKESAKKGEECIPDNLLGTSKMTSREKRSFVRSHNCMCSYCGYISTALSNFNVDHIIPISLCGDITQNNLQLLCSSCHKYKTKIDRRVLKILNDLEVKRSGVYYVSKDILWKVYKQLYIFFHTQNNYIARHQNPPFLLEEFIDEYCITDTESFVSFNDFYTKLLTYFIEQGIRVLSKTEVGKLLSISGYIKRSTTWYTNNNEVKNGLVIQGIKWLEEK